MGSHGIGCVRDAAARVDMVAGGRMRRIRARLQRRGIAAHRRTPPLSTRRRRARVSSRHPSVSAVGALAHPHPAVTPRHRRGRVGRSRAGRRHGDDCGRESKTEHLGVFWPVTPVERRQDGCRNGRVRRVRKPRGRRAGAVDAIVDHAASAGDVLDSRSDRRGDRRGTRRNDSGAARRQHLRSVRRRRCPVADRSDVAGGLERVEGGSA